MGIKIRKILGSIKRTFHREFEKNIGKLFPALLLYLYPVRTVILEVTNICNFKCPLCPSFHSKRPKGFMSFNNFLKIVKNLPKSVKNVELYLSGEPLLNKDLFKMISYLENRDIQSSISTNGSFLESNINNIINSGLSKIIIGLDGATEKNYKKYRIGGNFKNLNKSIEKFVEKIKKRKVKKPVVVIQFIVMKNNESDIDTALKFAKVLGVDAISFISVSLGTHQTEEKERRRLALEYLPKDLSASRYYFDATGAPKNNWQYSYCPLWKTAVILWNGDVTTCCFDHNGQEVYGNAFDKGFFEIWNGKKHYVAMKKILFRQMKICKTCGISSGEENKYIEFG